MAKLGENTPHIIDATVDFMASSQAFREYLKKLPPDNTIPPALTDEHVPLYIRRLEYYRLLYRPKQTGQNHIEKNGERFAKFFRGS